MTESRGPAGLNFFTSQIETVAEEASSPSPQVPHGDPIQLEEKEDRLVALLDKVRDRKEKDEAERELRRKAKRIIEAVLFVSSDPLSFQKLRDVLDQLHPFKPKVLRELIQELSREYDVQERSYELIEMESGFVLRTRAEFGPYLDELFRSKRGEKLSMAATETLAIITYRQPVTRAMVEAIRGVDCSGVMSSLAERGLIEVTGRMEAPGRPAIYSTTEKFLKYYGLKSLNDLPQLTNE